MNISGDWLDQPGTRTLCAVLENAGHQALFVGGCVRNALLGAPVSDIDIATDATPHQVSDTATQAGLKVVPTGIEHGTVTVVAGGIPHEITTFRRDVQTFGRHATVAFSRQIEDDAARRDFTMNALYARIDGTVVDPLNGLADLRARRLRFVGDPEARIAEDYLRILRFFRFHAWYGDPLQGADPEALDAIARQLDGLGKISRERIGNEMRKLLAAPDPAPSVALMQAVGCLARLLPGVEARVLAPLVHLEAGRPPCWQRRLAALGGPDPTDALRLSRSEAKWQHRLRQAIALPPPEAAWRLGPVAAFDAALITAATLGTALPDAMEQQIAQGAGARFPLAAADLLPDVSGPALGATLRRMERRWIDSGFALSRDDLLSVLRNDRPPPSV